MSSAPCMQTGLIKKSSMLSLQQAGQLCKKCKSYNANLQDSTSLLNHMSVSH